MAEDIKINGQTYASVPAINVTTTTGGTATYLSSDDFYTKTEINEKLATTGTVQTFFEIDINGSLMPSESPAYSAEWELDGNGDLEPKEE